MATPSGFNTTLGLGSSRFARRYSGSRCCFPFLEVLRCFSSLACPPAPMYSAQGDTALPVPGFPIRVSAGQSLFSSSPRLIAAVHALHRLLVPRHPPCALTILTVIVDNCDAEASRSFNGDLSVVWPCKCSFQGPARVPPGGLPGWSLKTQQYASGAEAPDSRLGRRSRCAARGRSPDGRLAFASSLERR